jgi:hypothetical protein
MSGRGEMGPKASKVSTVGLGGASEWDCQELLIRLVELTTTVSTI